MVQRVRISLKCRRPSFNPWSATSPEKEMATHSSLPAWEIPRTEQPGGLWSMGSQRLRQDWVTHTHKVQGDLVLELAHGWFHTRSKQRRNVCLLQLEKSSEPCFYPHMFAFKVSMVSMETTQWLLKKKFKKSSSFHVSHYMMKVPDFRP